MEYVFVADGSQRVHPAGVMPYPGMPAQQMQQQPGPPGPEPVDGEAAQRFPAQVPPNQPPMPGQVGPKLPMPTGQAPPPFATSVQAVMSMQQRTNRLAPVPKPQGLDPLVLLQERENRFVWLISF